MATSIVTTLLIPPAEFQQGGAANGRAMAYLAHLYLAMYSAQSTMRAPY